MKLIKEKDIAVELSPISNQVFGSAPDLRHHPANVYINHGIPFILGCENQGILKYTFTHQFYNAILAWDLDLGALKKIIKNVNKGIINKHASILPTSRGLWPFFWNVINENKQGVSYHVISNKIDSGKMLLQKHLIILINLKLNLKITVTLIRILTLKVA